MRLSRMPLKVQPAAGLRAEYGCAAIVQLAICMTGQMIGEPLSYGRHVLLEITGHEKLRAPARVEPRFSKS